MNLASLTPIIGPCACLRVASVTISGDFGLIHRQAASSCLSMCVARRLRDCEPTRRLWMALEQYHHPCLRLPFPANRREKAVSCGQVSK